MPNATMGGQMPQKGKEFPMVDESGVSMSPSWCLTAVLLNQGGGTSWRQLSLALPNAHSWQALSNLRVVNNCNSCSGLWQVLFPLTPAYGVTSFHKTDILWRSVVESLYCKFPAECKQKLSCSDEVILRTGQYLAKLWTRVWCLVISRAM